MKKNKKESIHGGRRVRIEQFSVDQESFPSWIKTLPHMFLNEALKGTQWTEYRLYPHRFYEMTGNDVSACTCVGGWNRHPCQGTVIPWLSQCVLFWAHNRVILKTDKLKKAGKKWGQVRHGRTCNTMQEKKSRN